MEDATFRAALVGEIPRLRRLAYRLLPPGVEPDDLVQDVLERAWRTRARFRGESALATWLSRIMLNRTADLARRRPAVPHPAEAFEVLEDFEIRDPQAVIERAENVALLRRALSQLDPLDRMVLALRDGEEWTAREVADGCGLSTEAVHKRLQRARLRLARELAADEQPGSCSFTGEECRQVRHMALGYLDRALDEATQRAVDEHLRRCTRCPPLLQALVGVREAVRTMEAPASAALSAAVSRLASSF